MTTSIENHRPAFLVTIDTEGDNLWARRPTVTTENSKFLGRFQSLCKRYGVRPTFLTNWEMAQCPIFREFGKMVLQEKTAEIGMHLHAWNSPPIQPLTSDDNRNHPYLIEFPESAIAEKVKVMTDTLEQTFGVKMVSHRAGRFGFNEVYARALVDNGYLVDGSVTPNVSWRKYLGDPNGRGGPDFSQFAESSYFLDLTDIRKEGDSPLLEIPVTVTAPWYPAWVQKVRSTFKLVPVLGRKVSNRLFPPLAWLYPKLRNHRMLPRLMTTALRQKRQFAEFMMHSSELMPGCSANYPTAHSIELLYDVMEALFATAKQSFQPMTMHEYYLHVTGTSPGASAAQKTTESIAK